MTLVELAHSILGRKKALLIGATTQVASTKTYSSGDIRIKDNQLFAYKNGSSSSTDDSRLALSGQDMRLRALKTVSGVEMS